MALSRVGAGYPVSDDRLMSVKEAAAYLVVVSRWTLYREMDRKRLSFVQIRSRRFIWKSELDRYLRDSTKVRAA